MFRSIKQSMRELIGDSTPTVRCYCGQPVVCNQCSTSRTIRGILQDKNVSCNHPLPILCSNCNKNSAKLGLKMSQNSVVARQLIQQYTSRLAPQRYEDVKECPNGSILMS